MSNSGTYPSNNPDTYSIGSGDGGKVIKLTPDMLPPEAQDLYILWRGKMYCKSNLPSSVLAKIEAEESMKIGDQFRSIHTDMTNKEYRDNPHQSSSVLDKQARIVDALEEHGHD